MSGARDAQISTCEHRILHDAASARQPYSTKVVADTIQHLPFTELPMWAPDSASSSGLSGFPLTDTSGQRLTSQEEQRIIKIAKETRLQIISVQGPAAVKGYNLRDFCELVIMSEHRAKIALQGEVSLLDVKCPNDITSLNTHSQDSCSCNYKYAFGDTQGHTQSTPITHPVPLETGSASAFKPRYSLSPTELADVITHMNLWREK